MIDRFDGEYAFLSNFYEVDPPITQFYNGLNSLCSKGDVGTFNSVEAAYQAGKCSGHPNLPHDYSRFTAREAKKIGKHETMTSKQKEEWNGYQKFSLMRSLLKKKFDDNHPELQQKLLATGDEELIEGNYWGDTIWGVCEGVGENLLGKMLMEIREDLKNSNTVKFTISYFYHVRNLAPTCLPISINMGEPNWFHDFKDRKHMFKDKRGVWNGAYIDELSSSNLEYPEKGEKDGDFCKACNREKFIGIHCPFIKAMLSKLEKLDFKKTISKLEKLAAHFGCNEICFMVYEKPDTVCGERWAMKKWFEKNGKDLPEFVPPSKN